MPGSISTVGESTMPLFFLMGGEIVVVIMGSRMLLWIWRGKKSTRSKDGSFSPQNPPYQRQYAPGVLGGLRRLPAPRPADRDLPETLPA